MNTFFNLFFLVCHLFFLPALQGATLHVIMVGDTKDKELSNVVKKDLKHMECLIHDIFDEVEMDELDQTIYTGKDTHSRFLKDLANLKIQQEDVIFFYYSGHGYYNLNDNNSRWPFLYFSQEDSGIHQSHVMDILRNFNARLTICIADCCNNIIPDDELPELIIKNMGLIEKRMPTKMLNDLFSAKGSVMISSASPGLYAEGTDEKGSCFTNRLIKILRQSSCNDWECICQKVQQALWETQKPQYEIR